MKLSSESERICADRHLGVIKNRYIGLGSATGSRCTATRSLYRDEGQAQHHDGSDGVRSHYEEFVRALPDLHIDVQQRHVSEDHVIMEVALSGTHTGEWNGLQGTGRKVEFPVCSVFAFDDQNKLAGERIYSDRATLLLQLGIFHETDRGFSQVLTLLTHPVTNAQAGARNIRTR